jgi:hypothetical protein
VLVNNLDLELRAAGLGGFKLRGNGKEDDTNNVEAVRGGCRRSICIEFGEGIITGGRGMQTTYRRCEEV